MRSLIRSHTMTPVAFSVRRSAFAVAVGAACVLATPTAGAQNRSCNPAPVDTACVVVTLPREAFGRAGDAPAIVEARVTFRDAVDPGASLLDVSTSGDVIVPSGNWINSQVYQLNLAVPAHIGDLSPRRYVLEWRANEARHTRPIVVQLRAPTAQVDSVRLSQVRGLQYQDTSALVVPTAGTNQYRFVVKGGPFPADARIAFEDPMVTVSPSPDGRSRESISAMLTIASTARPAACGPLHYRVQSSFADTARGLRMQVPLAYEEAPLALRTVGDSTYRPRAPEQRLVITGAHLSPCAAVTRRQPADSQGTSVRLIGSTGEGIEVVLFNAPSQGTVVLGVTNPGNRSNALALRPNTTTVPVVIDIGTAEKVAFFSDPVSTSDSMTVSVTPKDAALTFPDTAPRDWVLLHNDSVVGRLSRSTVSTLTGRLRVPQPADDGRTASRPFGFRVRNPALPTRIWQTDALSLHFRPEAAVATPLRLYPSETLAVVIHGKHLESATLQRGQYVAVGSPETSGDQITTTIRASSDIPGGVSNDVLRVRRAGQIFAELPIAIERRPSVTEYVSVVEQSSQKIDSLVPWPAAGAVRIRRNADGVIVLRTSALNGHRRQTLHIEMLRKDTSESGTISLKVDGDTIIEPGASARDIRILLRKQLPAGSEGLLRVSEINERAIGSITVQVVPTRAERLSFQLATSALRFGRNQKATFLEDIGVGAAYEMTRRLGQLAVYAGAFSLASGTLDKLEPKNDEGTDSEDETEGGETESERVWSLGGGLLIRDHIMIAAVMPPRNRGWEHAALLLGVSTGFTAEKAGSVLKSLGSN